MGEVFFPGIVTATAAAALVYLNPGPYPIDAKAYVVEHPSPTTGHLANLILEPTTANFANGLAAIYASLSERQEPLGPEFEAVWDANVDKLYEF
jgi:hypothetical protein